VLSLPQEEGGRYTALVAERQGETLVLRSFDPAADGAIDGWEELLGHDRVVKIHKKDNPTKKLKEVQLNPKNRCQFRKLVKHGTTELVTYTKVPEGAAP
jgi:ketosteroid isomerase-like protein